MAHIADVEDEIGIRMLREEVLEPLQVRPDAEVAGQTHVVLCECLHAVGDEVEQRVVAQVGQVHRVCHVREVVGADGEVAV